jgi:hypothetical protein
MSNKDAFRGPYRMIAKAAKMLTEALGRYTLKIKKISSYIRKPFLIHDFATAPL